MEAIFTAVFQDLLQLINILYVSPQVIIIDLYRLFVFYSLTIVSGSITMESNFLYRFHIGKYLFLRSPGIKKKNHITFTH